MTVGARLFARHCGGAGVASRAGIFISGTAASGARSLGRLGAASPLRQEGVASMSGSAPIQREIIPRITTLSSTTITRSLSCRVEIEAGVLINATLITSPETAQAAQLQR